MNIKRAGSDIKEFVKHSTDALDRKIKAWFCRTAAKLMRFGAAALDGYADKIEAGGPEPEVLKCESTSSHSSS